MKNLALLLLMFKAVIFPSITVKSFRIQPVLPMISMGSYEAPLFSIYASPDMSRLDNQSYETWKDEWPKRFTIIAGEGCTTESGATSTVITCIKPQ